MSASSEHMEISDADAMTSERSRPQSDALPLQLLPQLPLGDDHWPADAHEPPQSLSRRQAVVTIASGAEYIREPRFGTLTRATREAALTKGWEVEMAPGNLLLRRSSSSRSISELCRQT